MEPSATAINQNQLIVHQLTFSQRLVFSLQQLNRLISHQSSIRQRFLSLPCLVMYNLTRCLQLGTPTQCVHPCHNITSRGTTYLCNKCSVWVYAKCSGLSNTKQYSQTKEWACSSCATTATQQSSPPPLPSSPTRSHPTAQSQRNK